MFIPPAISNSRQRGTERPSMRSTSTVRVCIISFLMLMMSFSGASPNLLLGEVSAASGVDVHPINFNVEYTNSADETKYRLLSSNNPSGGTFNRPASLYVIDGMLNISSLITITVENSGTTPSGSFQMRLVVLHDEYTDFEILNTSLNVGSISGQSTTTVSHTWIPRYGGNHTMVATTLFATDDNSGNDAFSRPLAIGQNYFDCDSAASWIFGTNWQRDSVVSLSNSACHIGTGGSSSTHGSNWDTTLTSPTFDFSNAHPSPNTYAKLGFFYTGSGGTGDGVRLEFYDRSNGQWLNTVNNGYSISGVIDGDLTDGTSWLIMNEPNSPGGSQRPGLIIPTQTLNSQTKFRFRFISDSTDNNQGYWFEDIVLIYDEKAWPEEFGVSINKGIDGHARRGYWADHIVTIQNDGNLTDSFTPSLTGLPADWGHQFVHMSGSTILPSMSLELKAGESMTYRVQIQPGPSATTGTHAATTTISSDTHGPTSASIVLDTVVDPEYIPEWVNVPDSNYCLPGTSCEFSINLSNQGDGSDTFALSSNSIVQWTNWSFGISFNQPPTVTLSPQGMASVILAADIPLGALPGQTASIDVTATSQADPTVSDTIRVNLTASMVSDASVGVDPADVPSDGWWIEPGESIEIPFTIWNNATSQDSFTFSLDESSMRGWNATLPAMTTLVVRPGETSRIIVTLTAPMNAQSGDPAPILKPEAISQISGENAGPREYSGVRVKMLHELVLTTISTPQSVTPGQGNTAVFEIENNGNGPELAVISVDGLPSTWSVIIEVEGVELSGPVSLSPEYEGQDVKQIQLIITPPGGEDANLNIELTVSVAPSDGSDLDSSDNSHTFEVLTERITLPRLTIDTADINSRTNSTHIVGMTLRNDGNAVDPAIRIRIVADSMIPGITTSLTMGGKSVGLVEWLDAPIPPQLDYDLALIIGVAEDVPVGTVVIFTITVEGTDDNDGNSQTITETLRLIVDSHREISFSQSLPEGSTFEAGERSTFTVNVTSYSSFTEELTLTVSGNDNWAVICNSQENADGEWLIVVPTSGSPTGRSLQWDCELTAPAAGSQVPLEFSITATDGASLWNAQPSISSEEAYVEQGGFSFSNLNSEQMPMVIAGVAMLFLIFVAVMVIAINKKRRSIQEEYEDDEEEEDDHNQPSVQPAQASQPAQAVQPAHVAPVAQPQVSTTTDDQFRAAGWSEEKIAEYRREQAAEAQEAVDAQQQAAAQATYAQQVHHQSLQPQHQQAAAPVQQAQQPPQFPQTPAQPVAPEVPQETGLNAAFGSLGVTKSEPAEDEASDEAAKMDTGSASAILGGGSTEEAVDEAQPVGEIEPAENRGENFDVEGAAATEESSAAVEAADDATPVAEEASAADATPMAGESTAAEGAPPAAAAGGLPQVNCSFCDGTLSQSDQWSECESCGSYCHEQCKSGQQVCARCGSRL